MERIIKLSLPKYKATFDCTENLKHQPYCICYQYDVCENGCGPYNFATEKAHQLIQDVFEDVYFWDTQKLKLRKVGRFPRGLSFYGELSGIETFQKEGVVYLSMEKKNTLLSKRNKAIQELPKKPLILDLFDSEKRMYSSSVINELIERKTTFFINEFYTPEAGNTLILFDDSLIEKIKQSAYENGIDFLEVETIDDLKPW